jgi:hypothetical protein
MYKNSIGGYNLLYERSERIMEDNKKSRIIKPQIKQVHFDCEMALYKKFEEYCHRNRKDVSKAIRAYMKMCIGE